MQAAKRRKHRPTTTSLESALPYLGGNWNTAAGALSVSRQFLCQVRYGHRRLPPALVARIADLIASSSPKRVANGAGLELR